MGLPAKIAAIYGEIQKLPKTERNPHHGYAYTGEGYIVEYVRNLLHKHGVALFCSMTGYSIEAIKPGKDGWTRVICQFEFTLVDAETGETHTSVWFNAAEDNQDKGFNKAATAALKYFLLKTFMINTGEPDAHEGGTKIRRGEQPGNRAQQRPATPPPPAPEPQPEPPPAQPRSAYAPRQQGVQTGVTAEGETAIVVSAAPKGNGANMHLLLKTTDGKYIRAWTRQPFRDGGYEGVEMWSKEGNVYKIEPPALVHFVRKSKGGNEYCDVVPTIPAEKIAVGEHVPSDLAAVEL